jgi:hypothetical protein
VSWSKSANENFREIGVTNQHFSFRLHEIISIDDRKALSTRDVGNGGVVLARNFCESLLLGLAVLLLCKTGILDEIVEFLEITEAGFECGF